MADPCVNPPNPTLNIVDTTITTNSPATKSTSKTVSSPMQVTTTSSKSIESTKEPSSTAKEVGATFPNPTGPTKALSSTPVKKRRRMILPLQNKRPRPTPSPTRIDDQKRDENKVGDDADGDLDASNRQSALGSTDDGSAFSNHGEGQQRDGFKSATTSQHITSNSMTSSSPTRTSPKLTMAPKGPSLATPAVVSEKRILLHAGPAENLPVGWTIKHYKRTTGLKHTDRYWFSPVMKKKFRSVAQVNRFLDFLTKENGDEAKAWDLFRTSPPGPDEIRSRPNNIKTASKSVSTVVNSNRAHGNTGSTSKRRSSNNSSSNGTKRTLQASISGFSRSNKLPSLSSPGLYIVPPPSLLHKTKHASTSSVSSKGLTTTHEGFITPSQLFDHSLQLLGVSNDRLKDGKFPGSSVPKSVDDMFGSSVILDRVELVPSSLWNTITSKSKSAVLKDVLQKFVTDRQTSEHYSTPFEQMMPMSLSTPLPEAYIKERKQYFEQVETREEMIHLKRKQRHDNEKQMKAFDDAKGVWLDKKEYYEKQKIKLGFDEEKIREELGNDDPGPMPTTPTLPPTIHIPDIPTPPLLNYNHDDHVVLNTSRSEVKDKLHLVSHLDRNCFLLPEGRYYGLTSNLIADPQFVGSNAPGITGGSSNTTGLSTSQSGGVCSSPTSGTGTEKGLLGIDASRSGAGDGHMKKSSNAISKGKKSISLKKLMEQGNSPAEDMREAIIRAAVIASRKGTHGGPFIGSDGLVYPDVSKAFSNYGNLKPCIRCKNNKQGAYHCRLRRKHQEQDYDGGSSASMLKALFEMDLEELIKACTPSSH